MADAVADAEVGVVDQVERELDVLGGERRAVMPLHAAAQLDLPGQSVGRQPAILDGRNLAGEIGHEVAIRVDEPERREHLPPNALIDLDAGHQRMKDGRLLRQRRDHLPARLVGRIARTFGLSKGGSRDSQARRRAGAEQHELAPVRCTDGSAQRRSAGFAALVRHYTSPISREVPTPPAAELQI